MSSFPLAQVLDLNTHEEEVKSTNSRFLPLLTRSCHKMTLVLDLDGTLVYASPNPVDHPDHIVQVKIQEHSKTFYVKYRPGLRNFLTQASKLFELVLYTASAKEYAEQILNRIDPYRKVLKHRLYRDSCIFKAGYYLKDLGRLGRDLSKVIILDDSISSFFEYLNNGIPILTWTNDPDDRELLKAREILQGLSEADDVRPLLNSIFSLPKMLQGLKLNC